MKTKVVSTLVAVAVATLSANVIAEGQKGEIASAKQLRAIVVNTAVVELPSKAASIVAGTSIELREKAAIRVVRTFLQGRHSLAPSLVGAIAKAAPEVSPAIVAEATALFPESAYSIARAATAAAPDYSVAIAMRAAVNTPSAAKHIALAAANSNKAFPQLFTAVASQLERYSAEEALKIVLSLGRIGNSQEPTPTNIQNLVPLPGAKITVEIVNNLPVVTIEADPVQLATLVLPEDRTGTEAVNTIDIIARTLDTRVSNAFATEPVAAPVVILEPEEYIF